MLDQSSSFTAVQMRQAAVSPNADDEQDSSLQEKLAPVVGKLEQMCTSAISARKPLEERWMRNLEQFNGEYPAEVRALFSKDPERSKAFINITRAKTTGWEARLFDLLFPTDDKNWGIGPTPVPELTDQAQMVVQRIAEAEEQAEKAVAESNQMVEAGAPPEAVAAKQADAQESADIVMQGREIDRIIRMRVDEAKKRAERMEKEIADQLSECDYSAKSRKIIADACKLGSAVLKGPVTIDRPIRRWGNNQGAGFGLDMQTEIKPEAKRVDPWDFYPDPDVSEIADASYTFERHAVNRHKIKKMAKQLGFHMPTVRALLRDPVGASGNADLSYLTRLRAMGVDAGGSNYTPQSLYVVWEFHGFLETQDVVAVLRNFGRNELAQEIEEANDPFDERRVVAFICNGRLLKLAADYPMDSGETLYSVFSFEKPENSILGGPGIPEMMKHEQSMLNAGVRMLMDNAGLAVAPQAVIDKAAVEPQDSRWQLAPRKVWLKKSGERGQNDPAFEFFTVPMNAQLLTVIVDMALKFIDMVISMPMIAQGEQGQATSTLGGMSMLFNSANVVFRRVVKGWDDDVTAPTIRRFYDWNMQFSDKDEIKGDMNVEARGTSVLLVREIQSQMMMAIATNWSAHPVLGPAIKVYDAMRLTLQAMAINPNDVLVTPEEFEKRLQAAAQQPEQSPEAIRAQASIEAANISAKSREMDGQTRLQIAALERETAIMEMVVRGDVDVKRVLASLEGQRMQIDSDERKLATEAALEQRNAERAAEMGREPSGSGGFISMGSEARP